MNATDRLRDGAERAGADLWDVQRLAEEHGPLAIVDGELYAIDAEDGGSPGRWVHLVPPSKETAE